MELVQPNTKIDFMSIRFGAYLLSAVLIAASVWVWFTKGDAKYSVDFVGGTEVVVKFEKPTEIAAIRSALVDSGIKGAVVQAFEQDAITEVTAEGTTDFSIRLKSSLGGKSEDSSKKGIETSKKIREALGTLKTDQNSFQLLKQDYVGPVIGEQIRTNGIKAMAIALFCILVYISFRFEWRFAVGAIIALVHDVVITTGLFVFSGKEISAAVLAALLTIIGYSLNDTIIVFDRVRENLALALKGKAGKKGQKGSEEKSLIDYLNLSINQTLSRTVLTSLTTLLVVVTLWLLGGGAVADLAFALVIGVIVGTYSSIFVACTAIYSLAPKGRADALSVNAPQQQP